MSECNHRVLICGACDAKFCDCHDHRCPHQLKPQEEKALSIEEAFDKAAGYMWTPSEYPKKSADADERASLRAFGHAVARACGGYDPFDALRDRLDRLGKA